MVHYNQRELMKSFPKMRMVEIVRKLAATEGFRFILSYRRNGSRSRSIGCCRDERDLMMLIQTPDIGDFKTLYERSHLLQEA